MNMHDIVPLVKGGNKTYSPKTLKEMGELRGNMEAVDTLTGAKVELTEADQTALTLIRNKFTAKYGDYRQSLFLEHDSLPALPIEIDDNLDRLAKSPRVQLSEIRAIADRFGFLVIPLEYLDKRTYAPPVESAEVKASITAFVKATDEVGIYQTYVVCPPTYYSLMLHVQADSDLPIYPGPFGQAFMAINMSIPVFRQMAKRINQLEVRQDVSEKRQSTSERRLDLVEVELKNLARRLQEMEEAEERRQLAALAQAEAIRVEAARAAAAQAERTWRFIPYEPMLIAVREKIGILGEGTAIIGPCWGPDFDAVVATVRGYQKVTGQRQVIKEVVKWGR